MRESPWRSLARPLLLASALVAGACAPKIDLSNRPPPCQDNESLCPATGACLPDTPADAKMPLHDPANPDVVLPQGCPGSVSVIQGGTVNLPAPYARLEDVTAEGVGDLTATTIVDGNGGAAIAVHAPHGSPDGQKFNGQDRFVKITTTVGGHTFVRQVLVIVSFITAAPGGSPTNDGTLGHPFAKLGQAASVAAAGDTIALLGAGQGQTSDDTPGSGTGSVVIPDGVTIVGTPVIGGDTGQIPVLVNLDLSGDVTLDNLELAQRLSITRAGHHVSLVNDTLDRGLTVSGTGAKVDLLQGTVVTLPQQLMSMPVDGPLVVKADGVTLNVADSAAVTMPQVSSPAPLDAIFMQGNAQTLSLAGSARIENMDGGDALHVTGSANVTAAGGALFINPVEILGSTTSVAAFENAGFRAADLTFEGQDLRLSDNTTLSNSALTFHGQTLELFDTAINGRDAVVAATSDLHIQNGTFVSAKLTFTGGALSIEGSTSFTDSPLTFQGKSLTANATVFNNQGIVHLSGASSLTDVQFIGYKQFGYRLLLGTVQIMGGAFAHDPSITTASTSGPFALRVEAAGDTESSLRSNGTLYDQLAAPPDECSGGPAVPYGTLLSIVDTTVPISLCP